MDEKLRLMLDVLGVQDVEQLRDRLGDVKQRLDAARASYDSNSAEAAQNAKQIQALAAEYGKLGSALQKIEGTGKQGLAGMGQLTQGVGRFVQDFQAAGLNGVVNNLEQLGGGMAKVAGLAPGWGALIGGALQLAGVAALIAGPHIEKFFAELFKGADGLSSATGKLKALEDQIKALSDKPFRIALEQSQLEDMERRAAKIRGDLEAFGALDKQRTKDQKEADDWFTKAIVEHGGGNDANSGAANVKEALIQALRRSGEAENYVPALARARELAAEARRQDDLATAATSRFSRDSHLEKAQAARDEAAQLEARGKEELEGRGGVAEGMMRPSEENRARLERLARQQPGAFRGFGIDPDEFAENMHLGSPEAQEEYRRGEEEQKRMEADQEVAKNLRKRRLEAAKKRQDELKRYFGGAAAAMDDDMRAEMAKGVDDPVILEAYTQRLVKLMKTKVADADKVLDRAARALIGKQIEGLDAALNARQARDADGEEFASEQDAAEAINAETAEKRERPAEAKRKRAKAAADEAQRKADLEEDRLDRERTAANAENLKQLREKIKQSDDALYGGDVDERAMAALAGIRNDPTLSAPERRARMQQWRGQVGREAYRDMRDRGLSDEKARHFAGQAAGVYEGNYQLQLEQLTERIQRVPGGMRGLAAVQAAQVTLAEQFRAELDQLFQHSASLENRLQRMTTRQHR